MHFFFSPHRQIMGRTVFMVGMACMSGLAPAQDAGLSGLARAEMARRAQSAAEAGQLLIQGDESYTAGRYAEAVEAYRGALDLLPANSPIVAEQRDAALQRFSQASVERAREQRRLGDLEGAKRTIDAVLADGVAPADPAARTMREQLLDPIRTNPAVTKELAADIEEVRLLLYKADGAFQLGKYDEASVVYEDVLRVDPYNSAARRGMERVAAARASYARAAYDQTRAEMLAGVDREWETPVPPAIPLPAGGPGRIGGGGVAAYADKLETIRVPFAVLDDVNLQEAADFLRQQSVELDTTELDPLKRGVNFVIDVGGRDSELGKRILDRTFSLNLRGVPLSELVDYVAETTGTRADRQPFAVVFRPLGVDLGTMVTRMYRVPPDFLTSGALDKQDNGAAFDPFAAEPKDGGLVVRRLTAEEKLRSLGVPFPEGASASFYPGTSTLQVVNTPINHSLVEQIVDTVANDEPTSVVVEVKIIRTRHEILEELGFDWIVSPTALRGPNDLFGSGGTIGSGTARTAADFINPVNGAILPGIPASSDQEVSNIITGGLRSGDAGLTRDSIDGLLANPNRSAQGSRVAPGILGLTGLFTDGQVQMLMRGLSQKRNTDLAAVPSVVTRSGTQASVEIAREFIYPTEYEPPELPNSVGGGSDGIFPVTPAMPTAFETRPVGVLLEVLPTASENKRYVDVSLKPQLIDFDGFVNFGSPIRSVSPNQGGIGAVLGQNEPVVITENAILMPVFSKTATETALTVADGSTIVIGGLLEERTESIEDKVPLLGDVPVIGRLFQSKSSAPIQTAVLFLVKVRVVDAAGRPFHE